METSTWDTAPSSPGWISRLVEVLQPLSGRADRLGSIELFAGLTWTELEFAAGCLSETLVERGTPMTVQGRPSSRLWLIAQGEALVSPDARPIRIAGSGDVVGSATILHGLESPETAAIDPAPAGRAQLAETSIQAADAGSMRRPRRYRSGPVMHAGPLR